MGSYNDQNREGMVSKRRDDDREKLWWDDDVCGEEEEGEGSEGMRRYGEKGK